MKIEDIKRIGNFSDALFALEQLGWDRDAARDFVLKIYYWGLHTALYRQHQPQPAPADAPDVEPEQFVLTAPTAKKKNPKKIKQATQAQTGITSPESSMTALAIRAAAADGA